jgi:chromosome segregation ATPase
MSMVVDVLKTEVERLRGELKQVRAASRVFEELWHSAEKECEELQAENKRLRDLLRSASYHVEGEGDVTLLTIIQGELK